MALPTSPTSSACPPSPNASPEPSKVWRADAVVHAEETVSATARTGEAAVALDRIAGEMIESVARFRH